MTYASFRQSLLIRQFGEHLTPVQVARELEAQVDRYPEHAQRLKGEVCALYLLGDDWRPPALRQERP